jgi:hypothetical protein
MQAAEVFAFDRGRFREYSVVSVNVLWLMGDLVIIVFMSRSIKLWV